MSATVRDGLVKRGATWSYVVRVTDQETGRSKPKWVGGFPTEAAAKAARDEARVAARRGEYVDRSTLTLTEYLREWQVSHSVAVKPKTMHGYRETAERYVIPRIGAMRLQAVRPATLSRLYRDLLEAGGAGGRPLSPATVEKVHRMLSKAFRDAVRVEQLIPSSPVERATRPRVRSTERRWSGHPTTCARSSRGRQGTAWAPFTGSRPTRRASGPAAPPPLARRRPRRWRGDLHGIDRRHRRRAVRGHDEGRSEPGRQHRHRDRRRDARAPPRPGGRAARRGGWWRGDGDLVFRQEDEAAPTGAPSRPSCASSSGRPDSPTLGYTISGTLTRRPCSWPVSRFTSWLPAWATPTPASRSRSTPTSCASKRPE